MTDIDKSTIQSLVNTIRFQANIRKKPFIVKKASLKNGLIEINLWDFNDFAKYGGFWYISPNQIESNKFLTYPEYFIGKNRFTNIISILFSPTKSELYDNYFFNAITGNWEDYWKYKNGEFVINLNRGV